MNFDLDTGRKFALWFYKTGRNYSRKSHNGAREIPYRNFSLMNWKGSGKGLFSRHLSRPPSNIAGGMDRICYSCRRKVPVCRAIFLKTH